MLFPTGRITATPGALEAIPQPVMVAALRRHVQGDYGEVYQDDRDANDRAIRDGERILSAYSHNGVKFWVITEATREVTTFLLPDEY